MAGHVGGAIKMIFKEMMLPDYHDVKIKLQF